MKMEVKGVLAEALNGIQRARGITPRSFLEISALRWELYAVLQNTLDAMAMIVSDLGLRRPSSHADLGRVLCEAMLLDERFSTLVSSIALVRNTLAHAYRRLGSKDLEAIVREVLQEVEGLIGELLRLIEVKKVDPSLDTCLEDEKVVDVFARHGVSLAYLFGSRAHGTAGEGSDYDIAVLFQSSEVNVLNEVRLAQELAEVLNMSADRMDVVALDRADTGLTARILREGIPIYCKTRDERKLWERKTYLNILRQQDLNAIYTARAIKKLRKRSLTGKGC